MALPYVDTAGVWDWSLYQGDTRVWAFSLEDNAGAPIDVSGAVITMTIKKQRGATVPVLWSGSTTGGQIVVSGAGDNVVTITIPSSATTVLPSGALVYDVEFVESGRVVTYLTGTIDVKREVTL